MGMCRQGSSECRALSMPPPPDPATLTREVSSAPVHSAGGYAAATIGRLCIPPSQLRQLLCYASCTAESPMELILEVRYAWH